MDSVQYFHWVTLILFHHLFLLYLPKHHDNCWGAQHLKVPAHIRLKPMMGLSFHSRQHSYFYLKRSWVRRQVLIRKATFVCMLLYQWNRPPQLFSGPNRLCDAFRDKIITDKNFTRFYLKRSQNRFFEKHVSGLILRNRPPPPNFGAKWTMWRVTRQNCHERKLRSLLPKTTPKSFFRKICLWFVFTKLPPSPIFGAQRTMVRCEEKLSRTKTLLAFA